MKWDKPRIVRTLKRMHGAGKSVCYSSLAKTHQSLASAAAYHFGSYRKAIEKAGIDYAAVMQRPRWSKKRVISLIKQAKRAGHDLHWGAVTLRNDEISRAAFASLQPRLFGRWDRALHAAGLDADNVARYRTWDRNTVLFELRSRHQDDEALSSGALQKDDPGLHAAAVRYFAGYDHALRAAGLNPESLRLRRAWTRKRVIQSLRSAARHGNHLSDTAVRRHDPALYGAALRLFGSFTAARKAAKLKLIRKNKAGKFDGRVR
jgi:hypothetical protein